MSSARYQQAPYSDSPDHGYRGNEYLMSSSNPYATNGSTPRGAKKKSRKTLWIILGLIALVIIIVAAVLGGVLGSRAANKNKGDSNSKGEANGAASGAHGSNFPQGTKGASGGNSALPSLLSYFGTNFAAQTQTGANGADDVYLAVATDTYMLPAYATGTATAGLGAPTNVANPAQDGAWPADPSPPSSGSIRAHPRLIAPQYKWDALTGGLIAKDPYLSFWNSSIVANATALLDQRPHAYDIDGGLSGSGVLDIARILKVKIKNLAYAYRVTKNTKFVDQAWTELNAAMGKDPNVPYGNATDPWNAQEHFLDCAEYTAAFGIAYDWLHDIFSDDQKSQLRDAITKFGLQWGVNSLTQSVGYGWWTGVSPGKGNSLINGNWNCVCNGGMLLGALAIVDEDTTGLAQQIINLAPGSAKANCFQGAYSDGTWAETPNYWYFGTTGAAEMVSALQTAYGTEDLSGSNSGFALTSLYHMYVQGMTSLFNYGDHGPNKYSATANSLLLWGSIFKEPRYALYQRDHYDAAEPWSMFWYDPTLQGAWWNGLPIDAHFSDPKGEWASARTSWSDNSGSYWAMKAGSLTGHQTHGDLDIGDFVYDAMGQRWAGELGSGQYLADGYFSNENQDSQRWLYYRTRTDGQNTIYIGGQNQQVTATPTCKWGSTGTNQSAEPSLQIDKADSAFFTVDMSSAYGSGVTAKRGIRFLNGRLQMLLQDEISGATNDIMWRMHTNATVSANGKTANLELGGQKLVAQIVASTPDSLQFSVEQAVRLSSDPALPTGPLDADQPNDGVSVLTIDNPSGGNTNIQVLFTPQWPGKQGSDFVSTVPNVAIDQWSLTSHN